jgi:2-methylfumaryl-CoA isomerase
MSSPTSSGPLGGLRVIEVSSYVAAPLAGMTLAQLGAEVIRIDPIGGAPDVRRWPLAPGGTSLYWTGLNKGKQSVEIDLRSVKGQRLVTRLVTESGPGGGIVVTNTDWDWLSHAALSEHRRDLIHLRVLGMPDGAPAVDYTVNAHVGFPLITGPAGFTEPVNHVLPAWDVACGLYASIGLLSAERRRRQTGSGSELSISATWATSPKPNSALGASPSATTYTAPSVAASPPPTISTS